MPRKFQIAVIGSSVADPVQTAAAYEVGALAARRGWVVVNGGRGGVMAASAQGCADHDGLCVAVLPSAGLDDCCRGVSVSLPTGMGNGRNCITALGGDAVVVIGGGPGTLSEICFAWMAGRPLLACSWTGGCAASCAGTSFGGDGNIRSADDIPELAGLLETIAERRAGGSV